MRCIIADKKVLVGGCFDILHYGHFVFLKQARALGDQLIVALEPDERIKLFKQREPVHNQHQRAEILSALRLVDKVIFLPFLSSFEEYLEIVKKVSPSIIAITEGDSQLANKQKQAEIIHAKVEIVTPLITGFSSTEIMLNLCR